MFVPDPGYTFFDMDLDRADLQVVVWEAEDDELKQMLKEGVDVHAENAKLIGISRQEAKKWVHGTNYGGSPRTMAVNCGFTVHQAEKMQTRWFQAHPGILSWHKRTERFLHTRRYVENRFGFRRFYFDRVDALLPEALAWIPQSTVGLVINHAWLNFHNNIPELQTLLQVHDSLAGQFPTVSKDACLTKMKEHARIVVPYDDPLIIPVGIKTSEISWGDCE
jgi:DNA polymerase I-like protein with 3'-5' exonuclease and polymerase domains